MQRRMAKGLKVPCLFMITEVSIRCQKNPEVGIRRIPAYTPQYTTHGVHCHMNIRRGQTSVQNVAAVLEVLCTWRDIAGIVILPRN